MKIGIIADTHDHVANIKEAVKLFQSQDVAYVVHAGDYCSPFAVAAFDGVRLVGILGNNDGDIFNLMAKFRDIEGEMVGHYHEFSEDGVNFALYHGTVEQLRSALVNCGRYDVVISGHTHVKESNMVGKTLCINPG